MGKPRTSSIPIYDGDDFERITELRREVALAERKAMVAKATESPRAGDDALADVEIKEKKDAYDAFVREAAGRAEIWELRSVGNEGWVKLLKDHPPRTITVEPDAQPVDEDDGDQGEVDTRPREVMHPEDAEFGVNVETFPKALMLFVDEDDPVLRTVGSPTFGTDLEVVDEDDPDIDVEKFRVKLQRRVKRLAPGELETLWIRAWQLNIGGIADPKASLFSPDSPS